MRLRRRRATEGQILVLFAVFIPVLLLFFLFALGLAALQDTRAHARDALQVATRAGARQVKYASYGDAGMQFGGRTVTETVRAVFSDSLALRTGGLAGTPARIAADTEIVAGYGSPTSPWPSPFTAGRSHPYPTVAARARVPIRVWMFDLTVSIVSETEVK